MYAPFLVERAISQLSAFSRQLSANSSLKPFQNRCHSERLASGARNLLFLGVLLRPPVHNKLIRALFVPRLIPARRLAPRGHRMPTARSLALTAAVRMVDRIHRYSAVIRTLAQPPRASRLADGYVLVIKIADLPDRRHAVLRNLAGLARRQLHQRVFCLFGDQLRRAARRAHHLSTLARLQFQVMNL